MFLKLLYDKGKLLRCYTQNIDSLEFAAGLPPSAIVAAHGNFDSASVVGSCTSVPIDEVKQAALSGIDAWEALNAKYGGMVKPDVRRRPTELNCTSILIARASHLTHAAWFADRILRRAAA